MKVVTIGNEKGGVGKTTVAIHLAAILSRQNNRVLFIDADEQGTASMALGFGKEPSLYNLLVRNENWQTAIKPYTESMLVVTSNVETRNIAISTSDLLVLHKRLQQVRTVFDYVVIDISPTPSLLHGLIYHATDYFVPVTQLEEWSMEGLREAIGHSTIANEIREQKDLGNLKIAGIVPNQYMAGRIVGDEQLKYLQENYDRVCSPIPYLEAFKQAALVGQLVIDYAPDSKAAAAVYQMVDEIMAGVK